MARKAKAPLVVVPADYPGPTWKELPRWVRELRSWWEKNQDVIGQPDPEPEWDDSDSLSAKVHELYDALAEANRLNPKPPQWWQFDGDRTARDVVQAWLTHVDCPTCGDEGWPDFGDELWTLECFACDGVWTPVWVTPWGPPTLAPPPPPPGVPVIPRQTYTKGPCVICGKVNRRLRPDGPYAFVCHPKVPDDIDMGQGWGAGWISLLDFRPPDTEALHAWAEQTCQAVFYRDYTEGFYRYLPVWFRFCQGCGALFAARLEAQDYCSRDCGPMPAKYAVQLRTLAVQASPTVKRRDVFDRDGWVCHLCGQPIDPEATDTMDRASLDHVMPVARGGTHTLDNLKCAHLRCNIAKSDRLLEPWERNGLRPELRREVERVNEPVQIPEGWTDVEGAVQAGADLLRHDRQDGADRGAN